jgi:hypothetical protein
LIRAYHLVEKDIDDGVKEYRELGEEKREHGEDHADILKIKIF